MASLRGGSDSLAKDRVYVLGTGRADAMSPHGMVREGIITRLERRETDIMIRWTSKLIVEIVEIWNRGGKYEICNRTYAVLLSHDLLGCYADHGRHGYVRHAVREPPEVVIRGHSSPSRGSKALYIPE